MGFNISGIAINKSFKDNFDELLANFNWEVVFHEEVTFEDASKNWKDKELCDVFFMPNIFIMREYTISLYYNS